MIFSQALYFLFVVPYNFFNVVSCVAEVCLSSKECSNIDTKSNVAVTSLSLINILKIWGSNTKMRFVCHKTKIYAYITNIHSHKTKINALKLKCLAIKLIYDQTPTLNNH